MNKRSVLIFLAENDFNEEEFSVVKNKLVKWGINVFIASNAVYFCKGAGNLKIKNDFKPNSGDTTLNSNFNARQN